MLIHIQVHQSWFSNTLHSVLFLQLNYLFKLVTDRIVVISKAVHQFWKDIDSYISTVIEHNQQPFILVKKQIKRNTHNKFCREIEYILPDKFDKSWREWLLKRNNWLPDHFPNTGEGVPRGAKPVNIPSVFQWPSLVFIWSIQLFIQSTFYFLYGQLEFYVVPFLLLITSIFTLHMVNSTFYFLYGQVDFLFGQVDFWYGQLFAFDIGQRKTQTADWQWSADWV